MKKLNQLSESDFLKVLFGYFTAAFLIAALVMPDRAGMLTGLWSIISQPSKISTNYFAVGGYSATFLNMGLVALLCLALYVLLGAAANNVSTLAFLLTVGFTSWGINVLNMWPSILGVVLYSLVKREKLGGNVNAMLFSTGLAPLVTELMVRYPHAEAVGFRLTGVVLGLAVGVAIGFFLPAGLAHSPKVHKGYDLYSAALPVGMAAFFLQAVLYKTMGVDLPAAPAAETLKVASRLTVNTFCIAVFSILVIAALVQLVEMFLKKTMPALYKSLGVYLPLITTNCAVLGVALLNVQNNYGILEGTVNGFATAVGFTISIVLMAGLREKIEYNDIPKPFRGMPIVLLTAGLMSIAFFGFSGMI